MSVRHRVVPSQSNTPSATEEVDDNNEVENNIESSEDQISVVTNTNPSEKTQQNPL